MSTERSFYRAKPELLDALRVFKEQYRDFVATRIIPFNQEYPDNQVVVLQPGNNIVGFQDGKPDQAVPAGLSRSKKRDYLIPRRGLAGDIWQHRLDDFRTIPRLRYILRAFDIPEYVFSPGRLCYVDWVDFGDDGAALFLNTEFDPVPDAVEVMPRSEFWALHEKHMEGVATSE